MSVLDRPDTMARLFLGVPVPEAARTRLQEIARQQFGQYVGSWVEDAKLHLTLFFFGEVKNHAQFLGRLSAPLSQAFVPTVSITHIGRGAVRDQLWAYATPTAGLLALRSAVDERLRKIHFPHEAGRKKFTPHVNIGTFYPAVRGIGLADVASPVVFAVREAHLYRSELTHEGSTYTIEATVPF